MVRIESLNALIVVKITSLDLYLFRKDNNMNESKTHKEKVEEHLNNAIAAENEGDIMAAEKSWRYACFYEARMLCIDVKQYIADCCPVYG